MISLIMSGMNYNKEVYENMECKELLIYLFFNIANERNVNGPVSYATMFLHQ